MKKIFFILSAILLIHSNCFSQGVWDSVETGGFGVFGDHFYTIKKFKNSLYTSVGQYNARIYKSSTGNYGSWSNEASFQVVAGSNDYYVSSFEVANTSGGYLFAGTFNYIDGPKIYRTDSSNWFSFGTVPLTNSFSNYTQVNSMLVVNDTIYAAFENSADGAEIWKSSINTPTWTIAYDIPISAGVPTAFHKLIYWNGKIYAAANNSALMESSDGINWTMNANVGVGFGDPDNYELTAMEVFNNELFIGTYNSTTGAQVWKSADGITWTQLITGGFGNGSAMYKVIDMKSAYNKLWLTSNSYNPGGSIVANENNNRGGSDYGYTYISTDGNTFVNIINDGFGTQNASMKIEAFNNQLYEVGQNWYDSNGQIWRTCLPPTASFTTVFPTSACLNDGGSFFDNSTGNTNIAWYLDNAYQGNMPMLTNMFNTLGAHTIILAANNLSCIDSMTFNTIINPNPTVIASAAQSVCYGENATFTVNATGGSSPYMYVWDNGTILDTTQTLIAQALTGTSFTVTATDANNCKGSDNTSLSAIASTDIFGNVNYSGGAVANGGTVVLYQYQSFFISFDTVQTTSLDASGNYLFPSVNSGDYIIKVFPNSSYPTLNSTYFGDTYLWDAASVLTHGCSITDTANVTMIEQSLVSGPGTIGGVIVQGPGFGRTEGDPIPGIDVKLGRNPGGQLVTNSNTNSSGYYSFGSIALNDGASNGVSYTVYVDIPGLDRISVYTVTVDATTPIMDSLNYIVDSVSIYINPTSTSISNTDLAKETKFTVYPNPFKENLTISYTLGINADVKLEIYNLLGIKEQSFVNTKQLAGDYKFTLDNSLNSGVYFISLTVNGKTSSQRIIKTK